MYTQKLILLSFVALCLAACVKDKKTSEAERIVKEWIDKNIRFSDIEVVYISGKDSLKYISKTGIDAKEYKILYYADSTGCTSCKLRLHVWKIYIEELGSKVDFLFYFQPKNEQELLSLLKNEQFDYPVYIDSKNELDRLNNFPNNPQVQCFLLDKDDKIIGIGNPANNPKIWELYKKIITGKVSEKAPVTTIEAEQTEIELKDLKVGKTSEAIFVLKNTGTKPLVIQMVDASCGCTVPEWEKQPVGAGKSTKIKVKITPEKKEYFNKTVTVHCNTEKGKIMFSIRGTVEEER
jgi:hypothetical protein